jgi:thioredoxin 1
LVEVAAETKGVARLYAVDVDQSRDLARRMGVSGIPNVLLIKEGKILENLRGVLPKKTYLAAIRRLAPRMAP